MLGECLHLLLLETYTALSGMTGYGRTRSYTRRLYKTSLKGGTLSCRSSKPIVLSKWTVTTARWQRLIVS